MSDGDIGQLRCLYIVEDCFEMTPHPPGTQSTHMQTDSHFKTHNFKDIPPPPAQARGCPQTNTTHSLLQLAMVCII